MMKQTEIGSIPDDWEIKTIAKIGDIFFGGGTPSTSVSEYWNGNIEWTTSKRLEGRIYIEDGERKITKAGVENSSTNVVPKNNLIVSTRVTVGKVAINKCDLAISQDLTGIKIDKTKYDLEFLAYQILTERIQKIFESQKRGATIKGITREDLKLMNLAIPKFSEQRHISYILSLIQSAIQKQEEVINTTTKLKSALMQKLFTEGLPEFHRKAGTKGDKQKETEIGLVPESWEVVKIGSGLLKTKTTNPENNPDDEIKYLDVSGVSNKFFTVKEFATLKGKDAPSRARKEIQTNDIVFATVRPTLKRIAIIQAELHNQLCSTGYCVLKAEKTILDFGYLFFYLQTNEFIDRIGKLQRGASYPAVRDSDVKDALFPKPSLAEQLEISKTFFTLDKKILFHQTKKQTLTSLFKSMLQKLMTGEIRVNNLQLEKEYKIAEEKLSIAAEQ